jgi:hypothetical protein
MTISNIQTELGGQKLQRKPSWIFGFFEFGAMRCSWRDVPVQQHADLASLVEAIEKVANGVGVAIDKSNSAIRGVNESGAGKDSVVLSKNQIVELAVQTWRLNQRVAIFDGEKNPREKKQFADSLARFQKILEGMKVEIYDPVGAIYKEGWSEVEVISWEPPEQGSDSSVCRVKQTVSPIVRRSGEIIASGQIVVTDTAS